MQENSGNIAPVAPVAPSSLLAALSAALTYPALGLQAALAPLRLCVADAACSAYAEQITAVLDAAQAFAAPSVEQPQDAEPAQLEYTRLFIGSFKMYAPPYASYYVDGEHQVYGPTTMEVAQLYEQFGLELSASEHEPADHIRCLLAFAARLAATYEQRGQEEFVEAFWDFVALYILRWLPEFKQLVDDYAEFPLYPALTRLLVDVLSEEVLDA